MMWLLAGTFVVVIGFAAILSSSGSHVGRPKLGGHFVAQNVRSNNRKLQDFGALPELEGFGGNPDTSIVKLQVCQGDVRNRIE